MKRVLALVAVLSMAAPIAAHGQPTAAPPRRERVGLLPPSGTNVHEGYLQAAKDFLRAHLESTGAYEVAVLPGEPTVNEVPPYEAAGRAREVGAELAIVLHISRLGNTARVRVAVYDTRTGAMVHVDEMAAGSPDDLDDALARLAKSVATGMRADADKKSETAPDEDALLALNATSFFGIKFGVVTPLSRAGQGEDALPGLGLYWMYDARSFLAEITFDFHYNGSEGLTGGDDNNHDVSIGLGGYYPFAVANTAPYVGASIRYGRADYTLGPLATHGTGVSLYATGGVILGRTSELRLRAELSYFLNTFEESDGLGASANASGVVASVGLGF